MAETKAQKIKSDKETIIDMEPVKEVSNKNNYKNPAFFISFITLVLTITILSWIILYQIPRLSEAETNRVNIIIKETDYLLAYFFKLVGFFSFCLFLAMLVKRSAFALAFLFIDFILEWILLGIIAWKSDLAFASKIQNFFPLKSMYNLIEQPFQRIAMTKFPNKEDLSYDFVLHWYELLIVIIWTILFIILSYRLLKRRDL
mgnify:CR=1 FL=1